MFQIPTLYTNYQELLLDLDIVGKILSESSVNKDELRELLFEEYKITHPLPTLEDKRYELSDLVSSDYHIAYASEIELAENEQLVDLGIIEEEDDFELEGNFVVPDSIKEHCEYGSVTDELRSKIIEEYLEDSLEDLPQEASRGTEEVFNTTKSKADIFNEDDYEDEVPLDVETPEEFSIYDDDELEDDSEVYEEDDSEGYVDDEDDSEGYEDGSEDYDEDEDYEDDSEGYAEDEDDEDVDDSEDYYGDNEEDGSEDYNEDGSEDYYGEDGSDEDDSEGYDEDGSDGYVELEEENEDNLQSYNEPEDTSEVLSEEIEFIPTPVEISNRNKVAYEKVVEQPKTHVNREEEPRELREFVRKHPRCEVSFALQYFSRKEIEKYLMLGKIIKKGTKLHI